MAAITDKLYLTMDCHAWVGEGVGADALHVADLPAEDDSRWRPGVPRGYDVEFITLSPFRPSGRLGVCVEMMSSKHRWHNSNHPAFEGCRAWMPVSEASWRAVPRPESSHYVVMDETTLGYLLPGMPYNIGVLATRLAPAGSAHNLQCVNTITPGRTKLRQAVLADFVEYRVAPPACIVGQINIS